MDGLNSMYIREINKHIHSVKGGSLPMPVIEFANGLGSSATNSWIKLSNYWVYLRIKQLILITNIVETYIVYNL